MCYHVSQDIKKEKFTERYNAKFENEEEYKEYYHTSGFSTNKLAVITNETPSLIRNFTWGLVPFWVKDETSAKKIGMQCLNAIGEEVFEKPSFKDSIVKRRCLIPVTGFYEWRQVGKEKFPYFISVKSNHVFSLGGTWSIWSNKETGEEKRTFSILTVAANQLMTRIHNSKYRMPLILGKDDEKSWLDNDLKKDDIRSFIKPYDDDDMRAYTISKLITNRNSNSNCIQVKEEFSYLGLDPI